MNRKDIEKIAWAMEGLIIHSKGMREEFVDGNHSYLISRCEALKGFIKEIEEVIKNTK